VIVGKKGKASHRDTVDDCAFTHQRRDPDDAVIAAHDDDMQLPIASEAVPPGPHPFMSQERMRNVCALDGLVPFALESNKRLVVANDLRRPRLRQRG
jgi:hypothetical protein